MKFKICALLAIFINIQILDVVRNNNVKNAKELSMMEFMNSYFSTDKKAEEIVQKAVNNFDSANNVNVNVKNKKRHHVKHRNFRHQFKQINAQGFNSSLFNCTTGNASYNQIIKINKTMNIPDPKDTTKKELAYNDYDNLQDNGVRIEGELFISSSVFKNKERFPTIVLQNGLEQEIKVNEEMYRINEGCDKGKCELNFYFRLTSGHHLYYAASARDMNVLGAIDIKNVLEISDPMSPSITSCGQAFCFEIIDTVNSNWKLCAKNYERAKRWVCGIKLDLGIADETCYKKEKEQVKIVEKIVKEPIIVIPIPSRHCNENWNYNLNGKDWECDCKEGLEQSPIDLPSQSESIDSPVKPLFIYNEVSAINTIETIDKEMERDKPLKIKNFENAIRIFHHNLGKVTTLDGAVYQAEEIVFHTPAEHTINGKKFDMEIQIIHYGQTKGDISKQLILSFLVEKKAGQYNKFFDDIDIFNLPDVLTKEKDLVNSLYIPKLLYGSDEVSAPIMKPFSFYTYQGSLTAPPCSERTIHYVASKPIYLSTTTITLFQEALRVPDLVDPKGNIIVNNFEPNSQRKTQERNGRPVFFYDHLKYCGPDPTPIKKVAIHHYEKVNQKVTDYFYVNGDKPSGLPGAFVVTENEAKGLNLNGN